MQSTTNILEMFRPISWFIFDIDGVLTDGTVIVMDGGLQARRMSIKDGFALQMAVKNGYRVTIVSGSNSPQVHNRLERLGITDVHMAVHDKKEFILTLLKNAGFDPQYALYMGDDLPDIPPMQAIGLSCCPADAASEVRQVAKYISPHNGGDTCVRDVIEKVLRMNDHWHYRVDVTSK
jgi:3-deoxy-D-manno-octulosonate 8-phosphate phosphatase (KDO 8-P phosphatase)